MVFLFRGEGRGDGEGASPTATKKQNEGPEGKHPNMEHLTQPRVRRRPAADSACTGHLHMASAALLLGSARTADTQGEVTVLGDAPLGAEEQDAHPVSDSP